VLGPVASLAPDPPDSDSTVSRHGGLRQPSLPTAPLLVVRFGQGEAQVAEERALPTLVQPGPRRSIAGSSSPLGLTLPRRKSLSLSSRRSSQPPREPELQAFMRTWEEKPHARPCTAQQGTQHFVAAWG
jgi:hypothetical protein